MEIKIVESVKNLACDCLIIGQFSDKEMQNSLVSEFAPKDFKGEVGQTFMLHTQNKESSTYVLALGLGKESDLNSDIVRLNLFKAIKKCIELKLKTIAIDINTEFRYGYSAILACSLANYNFDKYKSKKCDRIEEIYLLNTSCCEKCLNKAKIVSNAMDFAKDLANNSASVITPSKLAQISKEIEGITTTVYDVEEIKQMKMGAYLAVGQGSSQPPKFIHMEYKPQNPKKRIALIGKGICFDSGGLDLKPASSMLTMRDDMSGASCVLGLMKAIAEFKPDVEIHGIIAACENMPSGNSYKPGDILTAKNGKTIEVDNTDAEGRLTLADALCYACELKVDEVIDIATLTGACVVALGNSTSGIMGNDDEFIKELIETGKEAGESFWQLPMLKEFRDNLNSDIADMKNTGSRYGGASSAGMFLKEFVTDDVKWAHIDIAGTAFLDKPIKDLKKGATAVGLRTLFRYITK